MVFNVKRVNAILLALAFFSAPLAGCFGSEEDTSEEDLGHWLPLVEDRQGKEYRTDDVFSRVSWNGTYGTDLVRSCLLYTSPSPRDATLSRMPSSA